MINAIIIAAGEGSRWNNYMRAPKHFAPVDGQPLLYRTVQQLQKYPEQIREIFVVGRTNKYAVGGTTLFIPERNRANFDADKFLNSKSLWNQNGRTVVFYGDVYFTDEAMQTIINHEPKEWTLFCRPGANQMTGAPDGECFAQSFYDEHIEEHEQALNRIVELYRDDIIDRCGGWEHYRAMLGRPDEAIRAPHVMGERYLEINDWTDDFDYPADYDRFINARKAEL